MAIESVKIQGFKSIRDQIVPLRNINVLIGGNGIGKTNFISAFELLRDIYDSQLQRHVIEHGGASALLHLGRKTTDQIVLGIEMTHDDEKNRFDVVLKESQDKLYISQAVISFLSGETWYEQTIDRNVAEASILQHRRDFSYFVESLFSQFDVYHFHDTGAKSPMKGVKMINDNRKLRRDGSNIAPFLYYLKMKHPKHFYLIERMVASVTPFFKEFSLEPDRLQPEMIRLEWRSEQDDELIFNDWQLSDGTLRFICLATLLLQPDPPQTIIIDEPELGLHPQAISKLATLIKKASAFSQLIVTTQSVSLVDGFDSDDIIVVDQKSGASEYSRLDSRQLEQWLEEYSLGEIWEMNIIGGLPL